MFDGKLAVEVRVRVALNVVAWFVLLENVELLVPFEGLVVELLCPVLEEETIIVLLYVK